MHIFSFSSEEELNKAGAKVVIDLLMKKPSAILGLATGQSPVGIYKQLVKAYKKGIISFQLIKTFNLDEYIGLNKEHPQSFYMFMKQRFFDHVNIPSERSYIPDGIAPDFNEECIRYDRLLNKIDLQILGIGHNGHIGFNEPGNYLSSRTHVVELTEETRIANSKYFSSLNKVPTHAITMGIGNILKAQKIVFVARGKEKAEIVFQSLFGPITTECPGSFLQLHPNLVVLLDKEAASYIDEGKIQNIETAL
ncbi:glucosamine-6-phosphate deaminase [Peribacillus cavernae]|uniref:Glucosamine-6-phosphate deaminase n=1 Tax=Peribacillus cavernae TaxID=1674310 RepID=A0A433HVS7_9BACI|nr:glucosamine-6-phosphate deaminase [Peribacillus cavernae]RUQ32461.1 glucosamine-6-phosphate deaminase [Peribacillus cavernae]